MRERDLFLEALDRPTPADRERFLGDLAAGNPTLAGRVRTLLRMHDECEAARGEAAPETATATATARPLRVGDAIGRPGSRYKLLQKLGEGGMGTVWAADQAEPVARRVAVKVIRDEVDAGSVGPRFDQERQALALMDHPHIARVFDAGTSDEGRPFLVMELVKGFPITDYADADQLPLDDRIALMVPVCRAVQHAHQKGLIHRDLKPSNVLVGLYDGRPVPKVIDFGVAKAAGPGLAGRTIFTRVGAVIGTPRYMAPEQAELDNVDVDTRADIYALGVLLYELVAGSPPIGRDRDGAGLLDLLREVRETEPDTPSARLSTSRELPALAASRRAEPRRLAGQVRGELDWIIMRCLEKDRARRYQTAEELAVDLENYLDGRPVLAGPPTRRYKIIKFLRKNLAWVAATAAVLAILVAATAVSVTLAARALRAESLARVESHKAEAGRKAQEREAAVARAVVAFLQDVFSQAKAVRQGGDGTRRDPELTVRAALDRAAKRIDSAFPGQPVTEAAVRFTLGGAYNGIGRLADARTQLERAVELRAAALGDAHPETLAARQLLAATLADSAEPDRSLAILRRVVADVPATDPAHRRSARHALAMALESAGNYEESAGLLREVLAEYAAELGPSHPLTLGARAALADADLGLGRFRGAEAGYREVLARGKALGDDHPLILASTGSLASLLRQAGRPREAEGLAESCARLCRERLGPAHPHTLAAQANLAAVRDDLGRSADAEAGFREVASAADRALGPDHPTTLSARFNLSDILMRTGRIDEAEPVLGEVLARRAASLGENHPATQLARVGLAGLYFRRGEWARAEPLYRVVIAAGREAEPAHLSALNNLATLHRRTNRPESAEPLFRDAYAIALGRFGPGNLQTETCFRNLISLYEHTGRPEQGIRLVRERLDASQGQPKVSESDAADLRAMLGRLQLQARDPGAAEGSLRTALNLYETLGRRDWRVAYARSQLGWAIARLGRWRDAFEALSEGHRGMRERASEIPESDRVPLIAQAAERLALGLFRLGRWDDALRTLSHGEAKP